MAELRNAAPEEEFMVTRTFDAPRDLVWKAFTENERLAQWWGPSGFAWIGSTLDLRPDGIFHFGMRSPEGKEMWGKWVFEEITPPESLVFRNSFSDASGNTTRAWFSEDFPLEMRNTLTLEERQGKTTATLRGGPVRATDAEIHFFGSMFTSMQQGFGATFDKLAEYLRKA